MTALERYARLEAPARYFDGDTAGARSVMVSFGERTLVMMGYDGVAIDHWPLGSLRAVGPKGQRPLQLTPHRGSDARLMIDDAEMAGAIAEVCPELYAGRTDRKTLRKGLIIGAGAVGAVVAMVLWIIPALATQLAYLIPPEREQRLGDAVVEQIQDLMAFTDGEAPVICTGEDGLAALATMEARLDVGGELPYPLRVGVIDHPLINAFAVPGGRVILFRGLIENAASPEEVAGVLAHEIGHVVHRDPTVGVLRAAGSAGILGLLVGDVFGAAIAVAAAEAIMNASYRREVEARADATAHRLLARAGLPSAPFASFFARLEERYGGTRGVFKYLASHPDLGQRAALAEAADTVGDASFRPVLSDREWVALGTICRDEGGTKKKVIEGEKS